jgi:hypothetical protein
MLRPKGIQRLQDHQRESALPNIGFFFHLLVTQMRL